MLSGIPEAEGKYWVDLEYRICAEFAGMPERRLQYTWCDGLLPSQYLIDEHEPRIIGKAWICNGPIQYEWDFTLFLRRRFKSRDEIDWPSLLPTCDKTRWLALDERRRYIEIEPGLAVPDPA